MRKGLEGLHCSLAHVSIFKTNFSLVVPENTSFLNNGNHVRFDSPSHDASVEDISSLFFEGNSVVWRSGAESNHE
jgi:hypothetical protein